MSVADAADLSTWEVVARLAAGLGLGAAIGVQREVDGRDAGVRTHALLALGCAVFGAMSVGAFGDFVGVRATTNVQVDVTRVASYVVAGVGFLAGGTIIKSSNRVRGLTTAASLWVASAVGLACGLGFYIAALVATLATLVVLWLERPIARISRKHESTMVHVVLSSPAPTGELVAAIERAGASAKRVHRSIRPDGSTEFEISGIQSAATRARRE